VDHQPFHATTRATAKGSSPENHDPPDAVQFSLRALLLLLTVASVLFAALAPYVPRMETGRQWRTGGALISILLGTVAGVLFTSVLHRRASARCGKTLMTLVLYGPDLRRAATLLVPIGIVVWVCVDILLIAQIRSPAAGNWTTILVLMLSQFLMMLVLSFSFWQTILARQWRAETLRLCEHGIVSGKFEFIPWEQVRLRRWSIEDGSFSLGLRENMLPVTVPRYQREALDGILKRYGLESESDPAEIPDESHPPMSRES
jgi:hypothetical protein